MSEEVNKDAPVESVEKEQPKAVSKTEAPASKPGSKENSGNVAVLRIRGGRRIDGSIKDTLKMLNLNNQHNLIIIPKQANYLGMLKKAKDYITWGEVSDEVMKLLESKASAISKEKKIYKLHPPKGGFERKGIKVSFSVGGALGYRKDNINKLIKKMV